jgi:carboxyl-terminal processing protease
MMKLRGPIYFSVLLVAFLIGAYWPQKTTIDGADKESVLIQTILSGLDRYHFRPQRLDDNFSEKVFDLYLDRLDGARRFLTKEDVAQLRKYRHLLDDEANEGSYEFFNLAMELLDKGMEKGRTYFTEILAEPFDFTIEESIDFGNDDKPFAKNDAELREYWRKTLKYETMTRLLEKQEEQEKADKEIEPKSDVELEAEAREAVLKLFTDWDERLSKLRRIDRLSDYLNAFTNVFDPHTGYYKPADKEDFDIQISGTLEGIGARLRPKGDYTEVVSIIPGGPAWKQKELEANDLIMKVTQVGEEPVDVTGMHIDDVVAMIRGKKGTEVVLSVKKVDGTIKDVIITRDVVIIDESYAKSVILDYSGAVEKVGYIKLPQFYADFNRRGGKSSARDVASEVEKLKRAGVNGIVIDLRNNTGGSLRDVVRMTGLFIEKGPIVQVKARGLEPEVLEDSDPRVQYDGPIIVMVNSISASASEIMAAALQDYGRAVIVGSKSTYGKGTVQRFVDLDRILPGFNDIKPLGQVKLTIQKFYRIDGGSTQLNGVTPDIVLPDSYDYVSNVEQQQDYPLPWTEIAPVPYDQQVYTVDFMKKLKERSAERVAQSEIFTKVKENAKRLKELRDKSDYPLQVEAFKKEEQMRKDRANEFKDLFQPIETLTVSNLEEDLPLIENDESKKARNDDWIKDMKKDAYLEEVLFIMKDMIELD